MKKVFQAAFVAVVLSFMICPANSQNVKVAKKAKAEKKAETKVAKKAVVFTEKEREYAIERLGVTAESFIKEVNSLSDGQLNFREDEKRWSIAEVAEHIILGEKLILGLIENRVLPTPVLEGKDNYRTKDQAVWLTITNRNTKFNAPERIQPKGEFKTKADLISGFKDARKQTVSFMKDTKIDLRNRFGENPGLGVIDAYQWFIFLNGHTQRHLDQIAEIKAHSGFPKE